MAVRLRVVGVGILFLVGCAAQKGAIRVNEGEYSPGKPKYRIEIDRDGVKNGSEAWWYENGSPKYQAHFEHGVRNGIYQAWYPEGNLWYQGHDVHGVAQDTLIYWYPNGRIKTWALFRDGTQVERADFDSLGNSKKASTEILAEALSRKRGEEAAEKERQRQAGIQEWSRRMRATVESYWSLPREMVKNQYRSVAKIQVRRNGEILAITWIEKSPSASFNSLAQKALKKIKKLPEFPASIPDNDLVVQYEFVTPGTQARRKLQLHGSPSP